MSKYFCISIYNKIFFKVHTKFIKQKIVIDFFSTFMPKREKIIYGYSSIYFYQ